MVESPGPHVSLLEEYPRFCGGITDDWHPFFLALGLSGDFPWLPSALQELDDPEEQAIKKSTTTGDFLFRNMWIFGSGWHRSVC